MATLQTLEAVFGWSYFLVWSATFYPPCFLIFSRSFTSGLSTDYMAINIVGFFCYAVFTVSSYYIPAVDASYIAHTGLPAQVEPNDVVFAVHGFILCIVLGVLLVTYPPRILPKMHVLVVWAALLVSVILGFFMAYSGRIDWFLFLNYAAQIKVLASLVKHIPQVILNVTRKSTVGFSFTMVCLDIVGGLFSLAQQIVKCISIQSVAPFTSNWGKTFLALESLAFDFLFVFQHLVLYTDRTDGDVEAYVQQQQAQKSGEEEDTALLGTQVI